MTMHHTHPLLHDRTPGRFKHYCLAHLARRLLVFVLALLPMAGLLAADHQKIDLSLRDVDISEAMEMLSRKQHVNILLADGVAGKVTVHLYDSSVTDAINAIANAAGYEVERRGKNYFVINRDDIGKYSTSGKTRVRTYRLQHALSKDVLSVIEPQLSHYGEAAELKDRNMLIVEDTPEFLRRIEKVIWQLDYQPRQILIEARILEITLDESEAFGIEWEKIFESGDGIAATRGLSTGTSGLFVQLAQTELEVFLDALRSEGRTRTLSTPKLLALESETASVIIGNRLGYKNTVTINEVTTESTEFLESGVILEVTPTIDAKGRIKLVIHPEISSGTVTDGVPSQTTTSVDTHLLVPDGATSFIGGLIKQQSFDDLVGVPVLSKVPVLGRLFSRTENRSVNTEVIVLITPRIVNTGEELWQMRENATVDRVETELLKLPAMFY